MFFSLLSYFVEVYGCDSLENIWTHFSALRNVPFNATYSASKAMLLPALQKKLVHQNHSIFRNKKYFCIAL
jgi:hypothetical protein